ncbi:cystinosin homolog [Argonauta hians]
MLRLVAQTTLLLWALTVINTCRCEVSLTFSEQELDVVLGENKTIELRTDQPFTKTVDVSFTYQYHESFVSAEELKSIVPLPNITLKASNNTVNVPLLIQCKLVGHLVIAVNTSADIDVRNAFVRVHIKHSYAISILNIIVGWIYFFVWSISFYPQTILNFQRKSVIGLNFDFALYNLIGFMVYGVFNAFIYWDTSIQQLYFNANPYSVLPVQLNDVVFTIHATLITLFTFVQIFIYERGNQSVSLTGKIITSLMLVYIIVNLIIAGAKVITWLQFLYDLSYLKLFITAIKYIPQCRLNFIRRSTDGWSIWGVALDFTGGVFSIAQMFLLAYNNDDWNAIFGDPTKFGLGVFSIAFDIILILQHYFYTKRSYSLISDK